MSGLDGGMRSILSECHSSSIWTSPTAGRWTVQLVLFVLRLERHVAACL